MTTATLEHKTQVAPTKAAYKRIEIGRILTVGSSVAVMSINKSVIRNNQLHMAQIGTILKILTSKSIVVAMVSSLKIGAADDEGLNDGCLANLNILGEITTNPTTRETKFFRGVRSFPCFERSDLQYVAARFWNLFLIRKVLPVSKSDVCSRIIQSSLRCVPMIYCPNILPLSALPVRVNLVRWLWCCKRFLKENRQAHVVLFDPHNEYSKSFGDMAEVISNDTLDLPLWMFDFVETVELLTSEIKDQAREEQEVLHDILLKAKRMYDRSMKRGDTSAQVKMDDMEAELQRATHITLDSPVPYRIRDVLKLLKHEMGKLENNSNLGPYRRLIRRIEMLLADPRYQFIFRNQAAPLPIEDLVGRVFRIPVMGKPISILDFSGIPSEALNIVVSVVSRLAFELATWSERRIPVLLVCEEAHRYIPRDPTLGFHSTRKIISRIAKEGRKYGVSLAIISQRPSELEPSTLSQCSTIFSMRLSNEIDQNFVRAAVPDGAAELLSFLPSLGTAETMVFGESVNMPMRVILNTLEEEYRPHSSSAEFTDLWSRPEVSKEFMDTVFKRWRARSLGKTTAPEVAPAAPTSTSAAVQSARMAARRSAAAAPRAPVPSACPSAAQMRQRMQTASAAKPQSLADVKNMLNTAFNRDM